MTDRLFRLRTLKYKPDAIAVVAPQPALVTGTGPLHLDDVRAEVTEAHSGERSGEEVGQLDDAQPRQRGVSVLVHLRRSRHRTSISARWSTIVSYPPSLTTNVFSIW